MRSPAPLAATALLVGALAISAPAAAGDPADHLELVPSSAVEIVGVDLELSEPQQRQAALTYLKRDDGFDTIHGWLSRARMDKGLTSALLMSDGIGQSAVALSVTPQSDLQRQTFEALVRASGLQKKATRKRNAPTWWVDTAEGPPTEEQTAERPQAFSLLQLSESVMVAGHPTIVEQVAGRLTRRGRKPTSATAAALGDPPEGSEVWFMALTPGAEVPEPIETFGHINVDDGALLEIRYTCRTEEDAQALRASARQWLSASERVYELAWLDADAETLARAVIQQVGVRVHVVLTLTGDEVAGTLTAALETLGDGADGP